MKKIIFLLLVLFVAATVQAETLEFDFDGPGGPYRTTSLVEMLRMRLGFTFSSMTVILVETPALDDVDYKKQIKTIDSIDDSKLEGVHLMYVTSCTSKVPEEGYRTSIEDARELAGEHKKFRVRFLDGNGTVYHSSQNPVSSDDIVKLVQKSQMPEK